MATPNPDNFIHVFRTFLGIPPDTSTPPVCGATLTKAYDWAGPRPQCPACNRIREECLAKQKRA